MNVFATTGKIYGFRPLFGAYFLLFQVASIQYERIKFPSPIWGLFFIYERPCERGKQAKSFRPLFGAYFLLNIHSIYCLICLLFPSPIWGLFFIPVPVSPPAARLCIAFCGAVPATDHLPHYFLLQNRCQRSQQAAQFTIFPAALCAQRPCPAQS